MSPSRTVARHAHVESDPYLPSLDALIMDSLGPDLVAAGGLVAPGPLDFLDSGSV